MTGMGRAVALADGAVHVDLRFTLFAECDIAQQRDHFYLLVDCDRQVIFFFQVEEAELHVTKAADASDLRSSDVVLFRRDQQAAGSFVADLEYDDDRLWIFTDHTRRHRARLLRHTATPAAANPANTAAARSLELRTARLCSAINSCSGSIVPGPCGPYLIARLMTSARCSA